MVAEGAIVRGVLEALDPAKGGRPSEDPGALLARLASRGLPVDPASLSSVLERMVADGEVEAVTTEDRGVVYTRPEILLGMPGLVRVLKSAKGKPPRSSYPRNP